MAKATQLWCGVDLSKATFDAALIRDETVADFTSIPVKQFPNNAQGISGFLAWIKAFCTIHLIKLEDVHLTCESTAKYAVHLYAELMKQDTDLTFAIVNPAHASHFRKSLGKRHKTDVTDARVLALFGRERQPAAYQPKPPPNQELCDLFRLRKTLVADRVAYQQRLGETTCSASTKILTNQIKMFTDHIKEIEKKFRALLNQDHQLGRDAKLLISIPGVGLLTAVAVMAELGDLRRFNTARQLSSFVGLSPTANESGTSVRGYRRISRAGNHMVRRSLYMAALTASKPADHILHQFYQQLVAKGKAKKSALAALMRKLLVLMRSILISGTSFCASGRPKPEPEPSENVDNNVVENLMKIGGKLRLEPKF